MSFPCELVDLGILAHFGPEGGELAEVPVADSGRDVGNSPFDPSKVECHFVGVSVGLNQGFRSGEMGVPSQSLTDFGSEEASEVGRRDLLGDSLFQFDQSQRFFYEGDTFGVPFFEGGVLGSLSNWNFGVVFVEPSTVVFPQPGVGGYVHGGDLGSGSLGVFFDQPEIGAAVLLLVQGHPPKWRIPIWPFYWGLLWWRKWFAGFRDPQVERFVKE